MRLIKSLLFFVFLATPAFAWLGGSGGGGGGGGGDVTGGGTGVANRLAGWTSATNITATLIGFDASGSLNMNDAGLTLRLQVFHSGDDTVLQQKTDQLILRDPGGVDRLLIQSGLPPSMPSGFMLDPIAAPAADATRDIIFKDTADGEIKVRKSTADGGAVVSLEGGGGGTSTFAEQSFIPTLGQTIFTVSTAYVGVGGYAELIINDASYPSSRFTLSGTTLTWGNSPFSLDGTDFVTVRYQTN